MKLLITIFVTILCTTVIAQVPIKKDDGSVAKPATTSTVAQHVPIKAGGGQTVNNTATNTSTSSKKAPVKAGGGQVANTTAANNKLPIKAGGAANAAAANAVASSKTAAQTSNTPSATAVKKAQSN